MQPGLDGRHRCRIARRKRLAARTMAISEQHHLPLLWLQLVEAGEELAQRLTLLALPQRVGIVATGSKLSGSSSTEARGLRLTSSRARLRTIAAIQVTGEALAASKSP